MAKPRDNYKYQFKVGNKIKHGGITNDLERREQEHQQKWQNGHIFQVVYFGTVSKITLLATTYLGNGVAFSTLKFHWIRLHQFNNPMKY